MKGGTAKFTDANLDSHRQYKVCHGCSQAFIANVPSRLQRERSLVEADLRRSQSEQKGAFDLMTSQGSYSQVLCDDCMSKQLQSSDAGSLQSLRFSHLLRDQNAANQRSISPKEAPKFGQFTSHHRFLNDLGSDRRTPTGADDRLHTLSTHSRQVASEFCQSVHS